MRTQRLVPMVVVSALALLVFSSAPALAATETPVVNGATEVTGNSAVLHGVLNPLTAGEPGEYQFYYRPSTEACRPGANTEPEPAAAAAGNAKEVVEVEVENLEPGTTYADCLVETGGFGFLESPSLTFKTLATAKPYVYKGATTATEVGPFSATLNAVVNPEQQETTYAFEIATNEAFTSAKSIPGTHPLQTPTGEHGEIEVPASASTKSILAAGTTYYFRIVATDATGSTTGPTEQFTTTTEQNSPEVISESLSAHNSFEPKLEARINPEYEETSYYFEYATSRLTVLLGKGTVVKGAPPAPDLPAVFEEEPGQLAGPVGITGLQPGTTYYYRVVANDKTSEETEEPARGPIEHFQADGAPALTSEPPGEPTQTATLVSGTVTPQGLLTTYHFAYVPIAEYEEHAANPYARGKETSDTRLMGVNGEGHEVSLENYEPDPVGLTLEELQPETTYVYALVATNELGVTYGAPQTFTTQAKTPAQALTGAASGVTQTSATVAGYVNTGGLQTSVEFELGTTPGAGALLPATVVPGSEAGTSEEVQATFAGDLQSGTTYYYRVIASNQDGSQGGAVLSFTTPGFPAAFPSATLAPVVPYTPIAQLDAKEAKEGRAVNPGKPGKKKGKKKKKRRKAANGKGKRGKKK